MLLVGLSEWYSNHERAIAMLVVGSIGRCWGWNEPMLNLAVVSRALSSVRSFLAWCIRNCHHGRSSSAVERVQPEPDSPVRRLIWQLLGPFSGCISVAGALGGSRTAGCHDALPQLVEALQRRGACCRGLSLHSCQARVEDAGCSSLT